MKELKGICHICKQEKMLSFEHIPPRAAFNKNTRSYTISNEEYYKIKNIFNYQYKGPISQGGMGKYCLCKECNSFLGQNYVRSYTEWASVGMGVCSHMKDRNYIEITVGKQNPLRILKQIISIFICINNPGFTDIYPDLLDFVKNPNKSILSDRYRLYTYLNSEGNYRSFNRAITNLYGIISEFTYPPFGFVLSFDNPDLLSVEHRLTEITGFKEFSDNRNHEFSICLYKHPTYYAIPLDFRTKEEFERDIQNN
ncbi:MAG: hypothetical protein E6767_12835 [Dysgonomonas sp.]|nr:hypothetical protein [Dysgonomonas sp.]